MLGGENGPLRLHYLAEERLGRPPAERRRSCTACRTSSAAYAVSPLYALVHESCYCDAGESTRWSAERVRPEFAWVDAPDGPLGPDR